MKPKIRYIIPACALFAGAPAKGADVAYFRFETIADGITAPTADALVAGGNQAYDSAGAGDDSMTHYSASGVYWKDAPDIPLASIPQTGAANAFSTQFIASGSSDFYHVLSGPWRTGSFSNFTLEAWVNFTNLTGYQSIVCREDNGATGENGLPDALFYLQKTSANQFRVSLTRAGGGQLEVVAPATVAINTWYHIAAVGNASTGKLSLYVNGVQAGSTTGFTGLFDPVANTGWLIGRGQFNGAQADKCRAFIDEVRFSDTALQPWQLLNSTPAVDSADGDGLVDQWETANFGDFDEFGTGDPDSDGFDNEAEETAGSDPNDAASTPEDIDADGLADTWEIANYSFPGKYTGTDDPDGDGYDNEAEETAGSNPTVAESTPLDLDADGLVDSWETANGLDPNDATGDNGADGDPDGDGFTNAIEQAGNSDPQNASSVPDSDGDGLIDPWEVANSLNPYDPTGVNGAEGDPDGDGFTNLQEQTANSDPQSGASTPVIAYYRFEEGTVDTDVPAGFSNSVVDSAGGDDNLNHYSLNGLYYRSDVPAATVPNTGAANTLSTQYAGNHDLYTGTTGPLKTGAFGDFSVESYVKFTNLAGYQTVVCRGEGGANLNGVPAALFYLGKAADNHFRVELTTSSTTQIAVEGTAFAQLDTWHHLAAVGDSAAGTLTLFVDGLNVGTVSGYTGLYDPAANTDWFVGRGEFNGAQVDKCYAFIDEVRFTAAALAPTQLLDYIDSDGDLLNDTWETANFGDLDEVGTGDPDSDGYNNEAEESAGSDPNNIASTPLDLDADGLADAWEIANFGDIVSQNGTGDPDGDLANNELEESASSDPNDAGSYPDTDADGLNDGWEYYYFPGDLFTMNGIGATDYDGDTYTDQQEHDAVPKSDPKVAASTPLDTDADGLADAWETANFGNLAQAATGDPDADTFDNEAEETAGSDPNIAASTPLDVDGDGLDDAWELGYFGDTATQNGTDDSDGDGYSNEIEETGNSDPTNALSVPDTDGDGLLDPWEDANGLNRYDPTGANGGDGDPDGDGYTNLQEQSGGSNPQLDTSTPVVAYYRFEEGTADTDVPAGGNVVVDSAGGDDNLNHWALSDLFYRTEVPGATVPKTGDSNTLSTEYNGNDDLYTGTTGPLKTGAFGDFSVETYVKFTSLTGYQTMVSRGEGGANLNGVASALFYLGKAADNHFRVELTTSATTQIAVEGSVFAQLNTWHHVSAVGDSAAGTLTLYVDGVNAGTTTGYTGLFDPVSNTDWYFGRGEFNGAQVDKCFAFLDEIRITAAALAPTQLLNWNIDDVDYDGLSDTWEVAYFGDYTTQNGTDDPDGDTFDNETEETYGSDPTNSGSVPNFDTDFDGLDDAWETTNFGDLVSQDGSGDPDGDGFNNEAEETAGSNPNEKTLTPQTVAYYRFEDGVAGNTAAAGANSLTDSAGGDDSLTVFSTSAAPDYNATVPGATLPLSGDANTLSLLFDTNDDGYSGAVGPLMTTVFTDLTVEAYVNWVGYGSRQIFVAREDWNNENLDAGKSLFTLEKTTGNKFRVELTTVGGDIIAAESPTSGLAGTWYHIAAVGDATAGTLKLYVNGAEVASTTGYDGFFDPTADTGWLLGRGRENNTNVGRVVNGYIDEVRISSAALAITEMVGGDVDADGLSDLWEDAHFGDYDELGTGDPDGDGFDNEAEETAGSDPNNIDSVPGDIDGDDLADTWELTYFGNLVQNGAGDFDNDGFTNEDEETAGTSPTDDQDFPGAGDGDGMDDSWETTYFGDTSQGDEGDFDGDGTDNLTEFRLGLIPNDGSSAFAATRSSAGLIEWPSVEGVTFSVQRSTTLGTWTTIATVPGTAGTASYTDGSAPAGAAFYRILLEP